jgi:D-glycero-alpha-D-manno-heptose-7-phosphate kinase
MKFLDMRELIVSYDADLPARTGLGTSSSFVVGMLNAFYALKGKYAGKKKLADEAIHVERDLCNEAGGWQDQIAASFGGFNRIDFTREGYEVSPVIISPERKHELNDNLLLFFSGFSRLSSEIQNDTKKNIHDKTRQLLEMKSLVDDAERILTDKRADINDFGRLLNETWKLKRQTGSRISTSDIDSLYERAMKAGAFGGKLLGAGGGGFLLFYVPRENQKVLIESLRELLLVPFEFENNGTDIIYYDPENYSLEE